jgi:hypothetical protein
MVPAGSRTSLTSEFVGLDATDGATIAAARISSSLPVGGTYFARVMSDDLLLRDPLSLCDGRRLSGERLFGRLVCFSVKQHLTSIQKLKDLCTRTSLQHVLHKIIPTFTLSMFAEAAPKVQRAVLSLHDVLHRARPSREKRWRQEARVPGPSCSERAQTLGLRAPVLCATAGT